MSKYDKLPRPQLERLAASGDEEAKAELVRRGGGAAEAQAAAPRKRKRLVSWQRPQFSTRYNWSPCAVTTAKLEMDRRARAHYAAEEAAHRERHGYRTGVDWAQD